MHYNSSFLILKLYVRKDLLNSQNLTVLLPFCLRPLQTSRQAAADPGPTFTAQQLNLC